MFEEELEINTGQKPLMEMPLFLFFDSLGYEYGMLNAK